MSKNQKSGGKQAPAQRHAEGEHGAKTTDFLRQQHVAQSANAEDQKGPRYDPGEIRAHGTEGKDRLFEDRQQHDDAENASEKTRLARDLDRHNHTPSTPRARAERQASAKRKG